MKPETIKILDDLFLRYPALDGCRADIQATFNLILASIQGGGKILTCGNGGSAADSEHIVGELLKKFRRHRDVPAAIAEKLPPELAKRLEGSIPAVSLVSMSAIISAVANDVTWENAFAQQALGLTNPGDILITLSTSGNSANCVAAAQVVKAKGGKVIAMTGNATSKLSAIADVTIRVPACETYLIQEYHLPIYHALCAALEAELF